MEMAFTQTSKSSQSPGSSLLEMSAHKPSQRPPLPSFVITLVPSCPEIRQGSVQWNPVFQEPGPRELFHQSKGLRSSGWLRLGCEDERSSVSPSRCVRLARASRLNGPRHSSDSNHSRAPRTREKRILNTQIPCHKAHRGAFYASAICHHKLHNDPRASRCGPFCRVIQSHPDP